MCTAHPAIRSLRRAQYHATHATSQRKITVRIDGARPLHADGHRVYGRQWRTLEGEGHPKVRLAIGGHFQHSVIVETRVNFHRQADVPRSWEQRPLPCRNRVCHAPGK